MRVFCVDPTWLASAVEVARASSSNQPPRPGVRAAEAYGPVPNACTDTIASRGARPDIDACSALSDSRRDGNRRIGGACARWRSRNVHRGTEDALLPQSAVDGFRRNAVGGRVVDIVGPHSLALCVPEAVSTAISEFVLSVSRASNYGVHRTVSSRNEG